MAAPGSRRSTGGGQRPPLVVADRLLDLLAACSSRTARTARPARRWACRRAAAASRPARPATMRTSSPGVSSPAARNGKARASSPTTASPSYTYRNDVVRRRRRDRSPSTPAGSRRSKYCGSVERPTIGPDDSHLALPQCSGDHARLAPAGQRDGRDLARRNLAVGRRLHLFARRQVDPQLEAAHPSLGLLRHLGVDDAARRRHPLHAAGTDLADDDRSCPRAACARRACRSRSRSRGADAAGIPRCSRPGRRRRTRRASGTGRSAGWRPLPRLRRSFTPGAVGRRDRLDHGLQATGSHERPPRRGGLRLARRASSDQSPAPRATSSRNPPAIAKFFMNMMDCTWSPSARWNISADTIREAGEQERDEPGAIADDDGERATDLERDDQRQQRAGHAHRGHVALCRRVAGDLAEARARGRWPRSGRGPRGPRNSAGVLMLVSSVALRVASVRSVVRPPAVRCERRHRDGGAALLGAERQPFGVHELDVADADEAEELPDIGGLQVRRRARIAPAARREDVGLLAREQPLRTRRPCSGKSRRRGPRDRSTP